MACTGQHKLGSETCSDERRKNRRLTTRLEIVVRQHTGAGLPAAVEKTCTENISSGDMYFESNLADRLSIGDIVDVDIELPVRTSTIFSEKRLEARGRIVRIEELPGSDPGRRGVAIVFLESPAFYRALA